MAEKFVQLLAINLDAERERGVEDDTFCKILKQIQDKQRKVTCAERKNKD